MSLTVNHCLSLLLSTTVALSATGSISVWAEGGDKRDPLVNFLQYDKKRSETIYREVESGLSTIPRDIKQAMADGGYMITITPTILTAMPGWNGAPPRGWSPDSNFDNCGGLFDTRGQRILIAEQVQSMKNANVYENPQQIAFTLRHEFGHAYDCFQGYASLSDDFVSAHTADADRLTARQQEQFAYFLQPNRAGFSELFAELFAAAYTPDAETSDRYQALLKAFPHTTKLVMQLNPHRPASRKSPQLQPSAQGQLQPPVQTQMPSASTTATQPSVLESAQAKRDRIMALSQQMAGLYKQGNLQGAEPVMRAYIAGMEELKSPPEALSQAYMSYANLLTRLQRPAEAKKAFVRARELAASAARK